jgi:hypothetical protein
MNRPRLAPTCLLAIACVSLGTAQAPNITPRTADARVPRTPWGHPDLQGRWTNATVTSLERPAELGGKEFFTEAEALDYQKRALQRLLELNNLRDEAALSGEFVEGVWVEERTIVPTRRTSLIVGPDGRVPPFTPEAQKRAASAVPDRALQVRTTIQKAPIMDRSRLRCSDICCSSSWSWKRVFLLPLLTSY